VTDTRHEPRDAADSARPVPFHAVTTYGREQTHLAESLAGGHLRSGGPFTRRASAILREETGAVEALLTTSCTTALELSALLLDLGPGDTVIVPSFTFSTTALAFARTGAKLLFCDIERETLGVDPASVAALLDETVRAVVVVHYAGIACDVAGLREVLRDRPDVAVVEDNAHGLFGRWRGEPLGSLGRMATLSFHDTKNIVCGEGGALLLNDPADVARAWVLYEKGTDRKAFLEGQVDKYSWRDTGSSFALSDLLAAFLLGQLEERDRIQATRREVFEAYAAGLAPYAAELGLTLPTVPADREPAWHLFHLLLPSAGTRPAVVERLREHGVQATFHYVPLHDSDGGRRFAARETDCPVTSDVSARLLRLPFHQQLTPADTTRVVDTLVAVLREGAR
jgi:dTDP-4-amino-4,6-dideoxygalactose transaminase